MPRLSVLSLVSLNRCKYRVHILQIAFGWPPFAAWLSVFSSVVEIVDQAWTRTFASLKSVNYERFHGHQVDLK